MAFASPPVAALQRPSADQVAASAAAASRAFAAAPQRRVRELMYGAGGAFQSFAAQAQSAWPPGGWNGGSGGFGGWRHWDDHEEWRPDPSWGVAPGVHVVLRNKCDEVYAAAVAQLVQMSNALPPMVRDPAVPVVVLLSWMGAQTKHVAKYTEYYESLGYEVHTVLNGLRTAIVPAAARANADQVMAIVEAQPEGRPVFFHAISIGTGVYGIFLNKVQESNERLERLRAQVAGVIFDSGPAPIFPVDVAKGLNTVCPMVSRGIWEGLTSAVFMLTQARKVFSASEDALRKTQFPTPQLYFYSQDDKVIPNLHKAVDDFVLKNKERGLEVYNKVWQKSVHAAHFKIHNEEYVTKLGEFTERCMEVFNQKKAAAGRQ